MFELPNDYYCKIPTQSIHCYLSNIPLIARESKNIENIIKNL